MTATAIPPPRIRAAVDWGSSSLRAYRLDAAGQVVAKRATDQGIRRIQPPDPGRFETVLFELIDDWVRPGDTVLLSGMIGSRNGWIETPYRHCPADVAVLSREAVRRDCRGVSLIFLPGICQDDPADVMRGEELQLLGSCTSDADAHRVILPGTHSKWAHLSGTRLLGFRTFATGELFELLLTQSLIGALADSRDWHADAFLDGVDRASRDDAFLASLFTARSAVLLGQRPAGQVHAFLSGLLIGREIREALATYPDADADSARTLLVGENALCERYACAFAHLGIAIVQPSHDSAARGFERCAQTAMHPTTTGERP